MYSLFQHPFITYTFALSTILAIALGLVQKFIPWSGTRKSWLYTIPLVVPFLSYIINYLLLGKSCNFEQSILVATDGFSLYHVFCLLNSSLHWVAPLSLFWLAFSLFFYGWRWFRTRQFFKQLQSMAEDNARPQIILSQLCHDTGATSPVLQFFDCSRPVLFTAGFLKKVIVISSGTLALMDDNELRAAFAHEMAHIRRMSHILNWIFVLIRDLTLFSPASLWAYNSFRREEERACDALAVAQTGLGVELASALVKMMKYNHSDAISSSVTCLLPPRDSVAARVRQLLEDIPVDENKLPLEVIVITILLVFGLAFIC